ncbi:MAG: phospholipid carrier-dependent glycosyltransferase [Candidatus Omnitrophota bacterium]
MQDVSTRGKNPVPAFLFWPALFLIVCGVILRLYRIAEDNFFFYDTGMYLNTGRAMFESYLQGAGRHGVSFFDLLRVWVVSAIQTDRPLWQLIVDARGLWGGIETWWYIRVVSAAAGFATLVVTYKFALRFFGSRTTALASTAFLAVLPGHILYSRIGLAESVTTFFFMLGFYFYMFPRRLGPRTFLAGLFFVCAFFSNYRLFILPGIVAVAELFISLAEHRWPDVKKWGCQAAVFAGLTAVMCVIPGGAYFHIASSWMFHQVDLAKMHFDWFNVLSYPYMIFRLETPFFAMFFFANVWFVIKKRWDVLLPFFLAVFQIGIFTFSSDKASRYIAVVHPFMAMAAAFFLVHLMEEGRSRFVKKGALVLAALTAVMLVLKSGELPQSHSAYADAVKYIDQIDPSSGIVTTQPQVVNLFVANPRRVIPCPAINDPSFLKLPQAGFRYLVLEPQAYVSWTKNQMNFSGDLAGAPGFFDTMVLPEKTFPHMNRAMFERFAFEHNQSLRGVLSYLGRGGDHMETVRVYNIPKGFEAIQKAMPQ